MNIELTIQQYTILVVCVSFLAGVILSCLAMVPKNDT